MYKKDNLREYIMDSELRNFSDNIRVRLSKELAKKYDANLFDKALLNLQKCFNMINNLNIKYPANSKPILYIYIVPDENYADLLNMPINFDNGKGGGKPVKCYDLDGFNDAYGVSQNLLENEDLNISQIENKIHELSHIVHSQFFAKNQMICEGFAEALPLYILDFEDKFEDHKNALIELDESEIFSAKQLIDSEKDGTFGISEIMSTKSCSFRSSYISSYLFVRGCIETIEEKYNCSKVEALQRFMEIVKQSACFDEWLIFDIANAMGISPDILLNGKDMQFKALYSIKLLINRKK